MQISDKFISCLLILIVTSSVTMATESIKVCWITEAWPNFTQKDGKGIYHDLVNAVFSTHNNVSVEVQYAPWKRAVENVKKGYCDMTGGIEKSADFHQSQFPLFEFNDLIVFKKGSIDWQGLSSLENKTGVWVRGFITEDSDRMIKQYARGMEANDFAQALRILDANRVDYMISGVQAFENFSKTIAGMNLTDYQTIIFKSGQLYMSFTKNNQGKYLRNLYDKGIKKLKMENIRRIYGKWKQKVPLLEIE